MKRTALAITLAAALPLAGPAQAAISSFASGNGELFLNVVDSVTRISYVLDLGVEMGIGLGANPLDASDFLVIAQQEIGFQRFWVVGDAPNSVWSTFLSLATPANLRWSVLAGDSIGPLQAGTHRLLTTVKQGDEAKVANLTNQQISLGTGSTQGGQFFGTVNAIALASGRGSHAPQTDFSIHGDSYSLTTDTGFGYYGKTGGLTPTLNGNAPFDATNAVGQSSWFYYLQRSGSGQGDRVAVDEFDNLGSDGYWGLVKVQGTDPADPGYDPDSPYLNKYLLSYTLPVYDVRTTTAFRSFAQGIGRTEFSGGMQVAALSGVAAAATLEAAAGWVTPLGLAGMARQGLPAPLQLLSPVPEPGTWLLLAGGLGLLLARRRSQLPAR